MTRIRRFATPAIGAVAVLAFVFQTTQAQRANQEDYLTADLRSRVEALKADFEQQRTDNTNITERAEIVWEWLNAYSLTGGPVPVNATQQLANTFRAITEHRRGASPPGRQAARQIDSLIYEFRLKDEQPRALGKLSLDTTGPFPAESWQTIEQTYTVGEAPLEVGATVMAARQLMWDRGDVQNEEPGANYLTIKTSNPNVRFEKTRVSWSGMHGGFRSAAGRPAFRLEGGTLRTGETFTLVYGDRTGGGKGWQMQSFQNDQVMAPVYIDLDGSGNFLTPAWPSFQVVGADVHAIKGFAPSVLEPGESFEMAVRSEDYYFNRATGDIPAYEVSLNGRPFRTLEAGAPALNIIEGLSFDREGVYRFSFRSADGKISGSSNPIWVRRDPPYRIYWGETHTHTGMAEGQGSIDGSYRYGRDDARLDFLGLSEHDIWLDDSEWQTMQRAVERYSEPGKFIAFLGYEWTVRRQWGGHHNVFFRSPQRSRVGAQIAPNLSALYQGLRERYDTDDVVIIPHAHQAGDWRRNDPDMESLIEIMSMHGTFEWFGNYYLRNGHQVGFIAASDDHRSRPGYTSAGVTGLVQFGGLAAALAPEKTNDAIFDALKQRQAYAATTADRIIVDFQLNGEQMGQRLAYTEDRRLRARIMGTAPISEAAVVKNGETVYLRRPLQTGLSGKVTAEVAFESSTEPIFRDNPRGNRRWHGTIEVQGANLVDFRVPHIENRHAESWERDSAKPNLIRFKTLTRGRADSLLLELAGATPSTTIVVRLDETREFGKSPVQVREQRTLPEQQLRLVFSELREGFSAKQLPLEGPDSDRVTLQLVGDKQPLDYDFEFVDTGEMAHGDYYYLRVKQLNGAMAWSSPIWVGGEEPR